MLKNFATISINMTQSRALLKDPPSLLRHKTETKVGEREARYSILELVLAVVFVQSINQVVTTSLCTH